MASTATRLRFDLRHFSISKCESRKVSYPSKSAAHDAAERLMDEGRVKRGCHLTPYLCADCHSWHIANRRIVFD